MKRHLTLLSITMLSATEVVAAHSSAQAFTIIFDSASSGSGVYVYDLELAPGEVLYNETDSPNFLADFLNFDSLVGVTNVTTSDIYQLFGVGFDETTVNLQVATTTQNNTGSTLTLDNIVSIFSNASSGTVGFDATYDEGDGLGWQAGFVNSTITGPTVTKRVPEPLTILGSATALGFGALFKREHSRRQKNLKG